VRRDLISFAVAWGIVSWVLGVTQGQISQADPTGLSKSGTWRWAQSP
jgi:hypothetical protein